VTDHAGAGGGELAELRRRVAELEDTVLRLAAALATMRLAPNGGGPEPGWTATVRDIARPLAERRDTPARQAWLREMDRLT
jgi:hypothetical protein